MNEYVLPERRIPREYIADAILINNPTALTAHVAATVPGLARGFILKALRFIYLPNGVVNSPLPVPTKVKEEPRRTLLAQRREWLATYLTPVERQLFSNLTSYRGYGQGAVYRARHAGFCCEDCYTPDVRTLEMDHVNGRGTHLDFRLPENFRLLCGSCHNIKSRQSKWGQLPTDPDATIASAEAPKAHR